MQGRLVLWRSLLPSGLFSFGNYSQSANDDNPDLAPPRVVQAGQPQRNHQVVVRARSERAAHEVGVLVHPQLEVLQLLRQLPSLWSLRQTPQASARAAPAASPPGGSSLTRISRLPTLPSIRSEPVSTAPVTEHLLPLSASRTISTTGSPTPVWSTTSARCAVGRLVLDLRPPSRPSRSPPGNWCRAAAAPSAAPRRTPPSPAAAFASHPGAAPPPRLPGRALLRLRDTDRSRVAALPEVTADRHPAARLLQLALARQLAKNVHGSTPSANATCTSSRRNACVSDSMNLHSYSCAKNHEPRVSRSS